MILTDKQVAQLRAGDDRYGSVPHLTFRLLVEVCDGWNEAFDAILEDALPLDLREAANCLVNREEIIARAQFRLARSLERMAA